MLAEHFLERQVCFGIQIFHVTAVFFRINCCLSQRYRFSAGFGYSGLEILILDSFGCVIRRDRSVCPFHKRHVSKWEMCNFRRDARFVRPNVKALCFNACLSGRTDRASLQSLFRHSLTEAPFQHPGPRKGIRPTTERKARKSGKEAVVGRKGGAGKQQKGAPCRHALSSYNEYRRYVR